LFACECDAGVGSSAAVFERFTERARQVPVFAQVEARGLRHNYIGTEHILLGLLREEAGLAARVLESFEISVERVRDQVVRIVGCGEEVTGGSIPFTPRAKKVLELALREALSLGHNYIGPEHILLGLLGENEGVAAHILIDFGVESEKIRDEVLRRVPGPGEGRAPEPPSRRVVALPHQSRPPLDFPIHVSLAPHLRQLLMVAAARALDDGRTDAQLRDLMLALVRDEQAGALLSRLGVDEASVRRAIDASDSTDEPPAASADS
jgi:ATP-dependent Clp protease ATP-binding subunit ClpA